MQQTSLGDHLRRWRKQRRMSQLDLALEAEVSQKHLSFVESGRASPSRDMVLRLADRLDVPKREQNSLLVAAGFAPVYREHAFDEGAMSAVRAAVTHVLDAHRPYPALAVDRHWTMLAANSAVAPLLVGAEPSLLAPPVNVLRLSLHPQGLAPRILNLGDWRRHILERLKRQAAMTADPVLIELLRELTGYGSDGAMKARSVHAELDSEHLFVPLRFATGAGPLDLISTTTLFGTPLDITVSEIAIETFLPATAETARLLAVLESRHGDGSEPSGAASP